MRTVLIVGGSSVYAEVFSKILTKRGGLAVKQTENVEEIMQIAKAREADIILMDVFLADRVYNGKPVDGIKIAQMLKADPQTADLPIILVTPHAISGDRERFVGLSGADDHISRPVADRQEFIDLIKSFLPRNDA